MMHRLRQTWVIARFDLGTALRTKRALAAMLLYGLIAMGTGGVLVWLEVKIGAYAKTAEGLAKVAATAEGWDGPSSLTEVIAFLLGGDEELAAHLLGIPLVVYGFFWVTLTFLPYLVAIVSHDMVNAELRNRSVRFSLLRTSRGSFLAGKVLAQMLLLTAVTVVSNLLLLAVAWLQLPSFEPGPALLYLGQYWLYTIVFSLCWIGLTALVSSLIESAGLALMLLFVALIGLSILSFHSDLGLLSPNAWKLGLWRPGMDALQSLIAFAAFGGVFLAGAWSVLRWRDL
jgi:ABC-type transport system involved in multi-copper enzyme maturation permease subunit